MAIERPSFRTNECAYPGVVGRTEDAKPLQAPPAAPEARRLEFVGDVVRSLGYVEHTRGVATRVGAGDLVAGELTDIAERLGPLHRVALVVGGWCAGHSCGAELTDPSASPSGARHCRACRVGWTLVEDGGRLRAVARPWPASAELQTGRDGRRLRP
jgi:hypothetical protein